MAPTLEAVANAKMTRVYPLDTLAEQGSGSGGRPLARGP